MTAALVCVAVSPAPAPAQSAQSTGTITGTVIGASGGGPRTGIPVTLIGARRDGSDRTTEKVVTNGRGHYRFE
ncbi:MAG: hypothetical protein H0T12_02910, partial [Actinobacteria bacterium]|nr:hypothetical protein [Actinomycetota bacterium]